MLKRAKTFISKFPSLPQSSGTNLPIPAVNNGPREDDTQSLIIQNAKATLDKKSHMWPPNLYAMAALFYTSLLSEEFQKKQDVKNKEARELISDFIDSWNDNPQNSQSKFTFHFKSASSDHIITKNDKNLDELEGLFSPMIAAIKCGDELKNPKEPFLKLLEWDMAIMSPPQSSLTFFIETGHHQRKNASDLIKIDQYAQQLADLYNEWIVHYEKHKFNPALFVHRAHRILTDYFNELLILNLEENTSQNHWAKPEIQQALSYYFDQRELLYKIYSRTAACPLNSNKIFDTVQKMKKYTNYIKEMVARPEEYTTKVGALNFGSDRETKFNAALDLYYQVCDLPWDEIPVRDPAVQLAIDAAKVNGRLARV